jgi:hypothetical protein
MKVLLRKCKKQLAIIWFTGAGVVFLIVLFQTLFGHYGEKVDDAWGWLLPTVMPTLSLIVGVLVSDAVGKQKRNKVADRFFYRLSFILSLSYLFLVAFTILMQPFSSLHPLQFLKQSHLWLAPCQGLVTATLGAFFVRGEES